MEDLHRSPIHQTRKTTWPSTIPSSIFKSFMCLVLMDLVLDDISNHIWWLDPNLLRSDPRSNPTKKDPNKSNPTKKINIA